ncbi:hypothetical protein, partial [Burkholderia multivorans]|uniref:hypothetical protein n=1 Tax=Burkholderia multivorans TaxID=87883 RepID=UPI001C24D2B1
MQAALFVAACAAHSGCAARAPAPDTPATAAADRQAARILLEVSAGLDRCIADDIELRDRSKR